MLARPTKPEELTNTHIQEIGVDYLKLFGEKRGLTHGNHDLAKKLKGYYEYNDYHEKWRYLADEIYAKLPNNNGRMAANIRELFSEAFKKQIKVIGPYELVDNIGGVAGAAAPIVVFAGTRKITKTDVVRMLNDMIDEHMLAVKSQIKPS